MNKYVSQSNPTLGTFVAIFSFFFALLVHLPASAQAQTNKNEDTLKFYYGPYAGYNINFHIANFKMLTSDCPTCVPEDYGFNVGGGLAFGGLFEYLLYSDGKPTKMRIGARLGYSDISANFVQEEQFANIASPNDAEPVRGTTEHNLEASIAQINFAPYFSYSFTDNFVGNAGLNLGYMMTSKFNQWEELTYPDYAVFLEEGSKIRNQYNDVDIPNSNALQFGILIGAGYELPIGKHARLVPEIQYNLNFNSVSEVDWNTSSLRIGLAAKFPIVSPGFVQPELHYQRDTIIEYKIGITSPEIVLLDSKRTLQGNDTIVTETYTKYMPKAAELNSNLSYYVMDKGQRKTVANIVIEEFETTEYFPFLPIVFFADGSSDLNQTKMRQLEAADAQLFKEKDLQQSNAIALYRDMLNILGERMTQKTRSNITIRGYSSEVGKDVANKQIGTERANAIKNYLVNIWKINGNRIKVEQTATTTRRAPEDKSYNDVVEENQRAQIYSDDLDLLTPVVISRIEKISNPPEVHFDLAGSSEAGLKNYNFTIAQQGNNLRQYENNVEGNSFKTTQVWNVTETPVPMLETPVTATLHLTDNLSQTFDSKQELTVSQITIKSKAAQAIDSLNMKIERYSLCLFDFDQANLTSLHTKILNDIKKSIQPNSELSIDGYADRTGELQHNIDLARRRCESVNHFINASNSIKTDIEAIGNQRLLYDNSTPEGRAFCRTVRIEIRTPNK